jgi:hypothetical protein
VPWVERDRFVGVCGVCGVWLLLVLVVVLIVMVECPKNNEIKKMSA